MLVPAWVRRITRHRFALIIGVAVGLAGGASACQTTGTGGPSGCLNPQPPLPLCNAGGSPTSSGGTSSTMAGNGNVDGGGVNSTAGTSSGGGTATGGAIAGGGFPGGGMG